MNYQGLVVELFKCHTVLSNRFSASRDLSRQDKNNNDWDTKKVSFTAYQWARKKHTVICHFNCKIRRLAIGQDFFCTQCDYKEYGPSFFSKETKRIIESKELPSCLIPCLQIAYTQLIEILVTACLWNTIHYYDLYWSRQFFQNKSLHVTCKRISLWTIPWQCKYSRPSNNWQKYLNRKGKEITSYFNLEVAVTFPVKKRIFRISCTIGFIVN